MSRLLFAAARGARIEAIDRNLRWILSSHVPLALSNDKRPYRIHPEDTHHQYGPISSALREEAEQPLRLTVFNVTGCLGSYWLPLADAVYPVQECDAIQRSLYLLILAEALADEGL